MPLFGKKNRYDAMESVCSRQKEPHDQAAHQGCLKAQVDLIKGHKTRKMGYQNVCKGKERCEW